MSAGLVLQGKSADAEKIGQTAEAKDIGSLSKWFTCNHLRAQEIDRTKDPKVARDGGGITKDLGLSCLGTAKVHEDDASSFLHHDVVWLDVAVDE